MCRARSPSTYDTVAPALGEPSAVRDAERLRRPELARCERSRRRAPASPITSCAARAQARRPIRRAGTTICTVTLPAATGCVDSADQQRLDLRLLGVRVDAAGNVARQTVSARRVDTRRARRRSRGSAARSGRPTRTSSGTLPPRQGSNADLAGYRIIRLRRRRRELRRTRATARVVCPGLGFRARDCFVQNLTHGQEVDLRDLRRGRGPELLRADAAHAHAELERSARSPACRRRCGSRASGAPYHDDAGSRRRIPTSATSASRSTATGRPRSRGVRQDRLQGSHAARPRSRSRPQQIVYVNLFAVDLSGNFSRVAG